MPRGRMSLLRVGTWAVPRAPAETRSFDQIIAATGRGVPPLKVPVAIWSKTAVFTIPPHPRQTRVCLGWHRGASTVTIPTSASAAEVLAPVHAHEALELYPRLEATASATVTAAGTATARAEQERVGDGCCR